MPELRLHINGSPANTRVYVGKRSVNFVQKVEISPKEVCIFFPMPSLQREGIRRRIEENMALVTGLPGVMIGHVLDGQIVTFDRRKSK